jgi:predicted AAA+ superfamily ATPase
MHPLSLAELLNTKLNKSEVRTPKKIDKESFQHLLNFGGFPEPYLKNSSQFFYRWRRLRSEQFFYEDMRDFSRIYEIGQVRVLADLLISCIGTTLNYSWLAKNVNVSVDTIRRWIKTLESLYFCFTVRPWFRNIPKSLRKQPKVYLWDWSSTSDKGSRSENFVASQLLKAVHFWTDIGFGDYELYYVRDKSKKEVDFLIVKNQKPWFLVEVRSSEKTGLNPNLEYYQNLLNAKHAFQVVLESDYVNHDCFAEKKPIQVPAATFLSQLV